MLYLGSNAKLRERKETFISVESLNADQEAVRKILPEPNVYFLGSHSGCSCGFPSVIAESPIDYYDGMFDDPNSERNEDLASVRELLTILDECLESTDTCTLFPVWNGSESEQPKGDVEWLRKTMSPETFVVTEQFRYKIKAEQCDPPKSPVGHELKS
jgi:hypothetical protein